MAKINDVVQNKLEKNKIQKALKGDCFRGKVKYFSNGFGKKKTFFDKCCCANFPNFEGKHTKIPSLLLIVSSVKTTFSKSPKKRKNSPVETRGEESFSSNEASNVSRAISELDFLSVFLQSTFGTYKILIQILTENIKWLT